MLTGYIIYPMAEVDLFNFDWEVSKNSVLDIKRWITSWARIPMKNHDEVLAMPFKEWFSVWWNASLNINKIFYLQYFSKAIWASLKSNLSAALMSSQPDFFLSVAIFNIPR